MSTPPKIYPVRFAPYAPLKINIPATLESSEESQVFKAFFKLQASGLCNMLEAPLHIKRRFPELSDEVIDSYYMRYLNDYEALEILYG